MKTLIVDLHHMRDLYSFMYLAQETKGKIVAHSSTDITRKADGKSQLGIMSLDITKPIIVDFIKDEDVKLFEKFAILKDEVND